jgi:hypothetical protein
VAVEQTADATTTEYNVDFGNLVTTDGLPVVDGEWTNRSVPDGTQSTVYEPSGDMGQCWGNAPTAVPEYLAYLTARGIGMTVWTMGNDASGGYPGVDFINADGDSSTFTTANNYDNWKGCVTPPGAATSGAGADLMAWFTQQDS